MTGVASIAVPCDGVLELEELAFGDLLRERGEPAGGGGLAGEQLAAAFGPDADAAERLLRLVAEERNAGRSDVVDVDPLGVELVVHYQLDLPTGFRVLPCGLVTFHDVTPQIRG